MYTCIKEFRSKKGFLFKKKYHYGQVIDSIEYYGLDQEERKNFQWVVEKETGFTRQYIPVGHSSSSVTRESEDTPSFGGGGIDFSSFDSGGGSSGSDSGSSSDFGGGDSGGGGGGNDW